MTDALGNMVGEGRYKVGEGARVRALSKLDKSEDMNLNSLVMPWDYIVAEFESDYWKDGQDDRMYVGGK